MPSRADPAGMRRPRSDRGGIAMAAAHRRHDISEEVWKVLEPHLPGRAGTWGGTAQDNRRFVNAIFWILRTGAPWRDLPPDCGGWKNTHRRFGRRRDKGVGEGRLEQLVGRRPRVGRLADARHRRRRPCLASEPASSRVVRRARRKQGLGGGRQPRRGHRSRPADPSHGGHSSSAIEGPPASGRSTPRQREPSRGADTARDEAIARREVRLQRNQTRLEEPSRSCLAVGQATEPREHPRQVERRRGRRSEAVASAGSADDP